MIIKLTLVSLIIILIAVIALSYYKNKEFFEDSTPKVSECSGPFCPSKMTSNNGLYELITNPDGKLDLRDIRTDTVMWTKPDPNSQSPVPGVKLFLNRGYGQLSL